MVLLWDLERVLGTLQRSPFELIESTDLKCLSLKTAFLRAVRIQELHSLSVHQECSKSLLGNAGVVLCPNLAFLPKVFSGSNLNQVIEFLPLFSTQGDSGTPVVYLMPC